MWTMGYGAMEDSGRRPAAAPTRTVANGPTGTNTQEAGVDEPDLAKTDGRLVVRRWTGGASWSPT